MATRLKWFTRASFGECSYILKITKGERTEEFEAIVWTLKISKRFLFSDELEDADTLIKNAEDS